jgi:hypothetical protein
MLDNKIKQYLSISVTGRVFIFCTKEGIKNASLIRKYEKQVRDYLEQKAIEGADIKQLEQLTAERLELLRQEIHGEQPQTVTPEKIAPPQQAEVVELPDLETHSADNPPERKSSKSADSAVKAHQTASYQEKLTIHRKPVVELLKKECVDFHLLSPERAKHWVHQLSGRFIDDIEPVIVNELSDNLLKNIRTYIRKNKNEHPWQTPMAQEQVRIDIASTKTIKGILTLTSQILWEIRQNKNSGNSGLLNRIRNKLPW